MEDIIEPNGSFDFNQLSLAQPSSIQGGAYFTKILHNNKPLYIQTPKCLTKQGFIKNGKKIYSDLMFDNNDEQFITWVENLETKCHQLIFEKSEAWFQNSLDLTDVESAFNSILKSFKSGKKYLIRTNVKINSINSNPIIKIYNENEIPQTMEDVNNETSIISILEIQGIKFTTRNFQIEIELKQMMILNTDKIFESCVIKKKHEAKKEEPVPDILEDLEESRIQGEPVQSCNVELNIEDPSDSKINDIIEDIVNNAHFNTEEKQGLSLNHDDTDDAADTDNTDNTDNKAERPISNADSFAEQSDISVNTDNFDIFPIEINLEDESLETIQLKKPNQVYYELYKEAREKAKKAKQEAVMAYLEAKNIKKAYMLEDINSSDDSEVENIESDLED
jgi:hypothetical protein